VAFTLARRDGRYDWSSDDVLVASAARTQGFWQLRDARGAQVVTLVDLGEAGSDHEGLALLGPGARLLGSIRAHDDRAEGRPGSIVSDADGHPVLVLRSDGDRGVHVVNHRGDVVAVASWEDDETTTDLLVTAVGTRHSLAMVFGVLLAFELSRDSHHSR